MGEGLRVGSTMPCHPAEVRADPARLCVIGPNGTFRLEPRVMDVLVTLAARAPETVAREALIDLVWGRRRGRRRRPLGVHPASAGLAGRRPRAAAVHRDALQDGLPAAAAGRVRRRGRAGARGAGRRRSRRWRGHSSGGTRRICRCSSTRSATACTRTARSGSRSRSTMRGWPASARSRRPASPRRTGGLPPTAMPR